MPVIELRNICKRFEIKKGRTELILHPFRKRYKEVLNDFSLSLKNSGIYSLTGPNGSGKTTLLRIISGILYPDSGEVLIDNVAFRLNPNKVFLIAESDKGFFPRLTLWQNLRFFGSLINKDRKIVNDKIEIILNDFELTKEKDTRFQELSSGTKQRLAIARAMLFDPDILLFDEITKGIDIKQQHYVYSLLKKLRKAGKTIIFATHLINEIRDLSDQIILINQGRIVSIGSFEETEKDIKRIFEIE